MRKLGGLLTVALLLCACSSGGGSGSVDTSHDQDKADAAVLKASDIHGFTDDTSSSSSDSSSSSSDPSDKCFTEATGVDPKAVDADRTGKAEREFKKGSGLDQVSVRVQVELHKTGDQMKKQLDAFSKPEVQSCFKDAIAGQAASNGSGATFTNIDVTFQPLSGLGDQAGEFVVKSTVSAQGLSVPIGFEIAFVRKGRAGVLVFVTAINGTPDHNLLVNAINTMLSRVQQ